MKNTQKNHPHPWLKHIKTQKEAFLGHKSAQNGDFHAKSTSRIDFFIILAVFMIHCGVSAYVVFARDISITADAGRNFWDYFWQNLPANELQTAPLQALWNFHAQPPLFNLMAAFMMKIFGEAFLPRLHLFYVLLGATTCSMTYYMAKTLLRKTWVALTIALLWTINPALPVYEAYMLYDIPTLFLVMLTATTLAKWERDRKNSRLYLFYALANLLMLTRSLFHAVLLPFILFFVVLLPEKRKFRILIISILISFATIGWYTKNQVQFGFFGASSWSGMNHWRLVWAYYPPEGLQDLAKNDQLDPMVTQVEAFEPPSAYTIYGFTNTSPVAVLSQNNYNNINIPAISAVYGKNAVSLIKIDPAHYFKNALCAFRIYCMPPTVFKHFDANNWKIEKWQKAWNKCMGYDLLKRENWQDGPNSWYFFIIPAAFLVFLGVICAKTGLKQRNMAFFIQNNALYCFIAGIVVYTTLIACFFELGENHRIRFIIDPLIWLFLAETIHQLIPQKAINPRT